MDRLSNGESQELGQALRNAAQAAWSIKSGEPSTVKLSSLQKRRMANESYLLLRRKNITLPQTFFLAATDKTKVYVSYLDNARQILVREEGRAEHSRSSAPLVLQSFCRLSANDCFHCVDLLPYVAMTSHAVAGPDSTKPHAQDCSVELPRDIIASIQWQMLREGWRASTKRFALKRDMGLMPNGTPVQVDPETVQDLPLFEFDRQSALHRLYEMQNDLNLPPEMHYVDRDGVTIQEKIFPNPF
jgi:hypothetical protein